MAITPSKKSPSLEGRAAAAAARRLAAEQAAATRAALLAAEAARLARHATGIFGFSTFIAGGLQALAATRRGGLSAAAEGQFRTAHVGGTVHAALLLGLVGALRELRGLRDAADVRALVSAAALMGWGNSVGYTVGALLGKRGLEPRADGNISPFSLFCAAIAGLARTLQLLWKGCTGAGAGAGAAAAPAGGGSAGGGSAAGEECEVVD